MRRSRGCALLCDTDCEFAEPAVVPGVGAFDDPSGVPAWSGVPFLLITQSQPRVASRSVWRQVSPGATRSSSPASSAPTNTCTERYLSSATNPKDGQLGMLRERAKPSDRLSDPTASSIHRIDLIELLRLPFMRVRALAVLSAAAREAAQ